MVVAGRKDGGAERERDERVREPGIVVVPVGEPEWRAARLARGRFGRGRHKASLNFRDGLSHATAAAAGDTWLFVGNAFRHTAIPPAR
jgi:ribonuclease VapC